MVELTPAEAEAAELIESTYAKYGKGFLSCSCGMEWVYVTESFNGDAIRIRLVRDTIKHARTKHTVPYAVVFTAVPVTVMEATRTINRKEHHQ